MASAQSVSSGNTNQSTESVITAIVTGLIVAGAEVAAFVLLKDRIRQIYKPRTYRVPTERRVEPLSHSFLGWIPQLLRTPARSILERNGLDAYVFVRFLFLMLEIFFPFWVVTWIILLPVDAAKSGGGQTGVSMFTFGNVGPAHQNRYAAHLILAWLLTFWVLYLVKREFSHFIVLRQEFLMSEQHRRLPQSKTVLVTGVPKEYLDREAMYRFCRPVPGGAKRVWFARDLKDLPDIFDRRAKAVSKLESAETKLLKLATKQVAKDQKKNRSPPEDSDPEAHKAAIMRYVPQKKRPTHKLGKFGLYGKKVDSIDWAREEIVKTTQELETERGLLGGDKYPYDSAVFIEFHSQMAAHMFAQCLNHHAPLRMSSRYLEVGVEDVIFSNLSMNPYQQRIRSFISWGLTLGLILTWTAPVAFVGAISNVSYLCSTVSWMRWLCELPVPVNGIIQGALPPIALAVLFMLVPIIMRLLARFEGIPLRTQVELSLTVRYFIFMVIDGFLIITLSSGLIAAIPEITQNPGSAPLLLARQLPNAATFFLTYFVTASFAGAAGALLQIAHLAVYYVKLVLLGSTPRAVWNIKSWFPAVAWGTLWPSMTLLTVIGLVYSIIAPLICGFACVAFALFWFAYKYLFLYVIETAPETETGGLHYPKALTHIFVGLYIEQVCLAALFFLAQNSAGKQSAIPEGALMVVLIVITAIFQLILRSGYKPLITYLPLSIADQIGESEHVPASGAGSDPRRSMQVESGRQEKDVSRETARTHTDGHEMLRAKESRGRETDISTAGSYHGAHGSHEYDEDLDRAFDHPATYQGYDTVWLPEDPHGFYRDEVEATRSAGVNVSSDNAVMNEKGKVDVSRAPPGEDWDASQEL
ncbi:hypothetical protein BMF94_5187 [Rhodotorula taiwanensis]|uniref:DUF221-domain-containing protein n=1 Tax=Rhodotorula taiwanensis TaxID=741276 RepID=A0A2S5B4Z0_9BASI|nr:hypothetical protein BMF94_5187 [Rhodotorula taiwanensis]